MPLLTQYYALKDESRLPLGSKVVDPYDNSIHKPVDSDTLESFLKRISASRASKSLPEIPALELGDYVVASLYTNASPREKEALFVRKAMTPAFGQIKSLATALAKETSSLAQVPLLTKEKRAADCLACKLHQTSKTGSSAVDKLAQTRLKDLTKVSCESRLGVCGMCGCGVSAKIKFNASSILASMSPEMISYGARLLGAGIFSSCWMLGECAEDGRLSRILDRKVENLPPDDLAKSLYYSHKQAALQKAVKNTKERKPATQTQPKQSNETSIELKRSSVYGAAHSKYE